MDEYTPPNIDEQLRLAYEHCLYVLFEPPVTLKVDKNNTELDHYLKEKALDRVVLLTAYNPHSEQCSLEENRRRQMELEALIFTEGWPYQKGENRDPDGDWPVEPTFVVFGITEEQAAVVASSFHQLAFVYYGIDEVAKLVFIK